MNKYIVTGKYSGPATATIIARSLEDALQKLANAEEDDLEIDDPSRFEYQAGEVKEV